MDSDYIILRDSDLTCFDPAPKSSLPCDLQYSPQIMNLVDFLLKLPFEDTYNLINNVAQTNDSNSNASHCKTMAKAKKATNPLLVDTDLEKTITVKKDLLNRESYIDTENLKAIANDCMSTWYTYMPSMQVFPTKKMGKITHFSAVTPCEGRKSLDVFLNERKRLAVNPAFLGSPKRQKTVKVHVKYTPASKSPKVKSIRRNSTNSFHSPISERHKKDFTKKKSISINEVSKRKTLIYIEQAMEIFYLDPNLDPRTKTFQPGEIVLKKVHFEADLIADPKQIEDNDIVSNIVTSTSEIKLRDPRLKHSKIYPNYSNAVNTTDQTSSTELVDSTIDISSHQSETVPPSDPHAKSSVQLSSGSSTSPESLTEISIDRAPIRINVCASLNAVPIYKSGPQTLPNTEEPVADRPIGNSINDNLSTISDIASSVQGNAILSSGYQSNASKKSTQSSSVKRSSSCLNSDNQAIVLKKRVKYSSNIDSLSLNKCDNIPSLVLTASDSVQLPSEANQSAKIFSTNTVSNVRPSVSNKHKSKEAKKPFLNPKHEKKFSSDVSKEKQVSLIKVLASKDELGNQPSVEMPSNICSTSKDVKKYCLNIPKRDFKILHEPSSNSKCMEKSSKTASSSKTKVTQKPLSPVSTKQDCDRLEKPTSDSKCVEESSKTVSPTEVKHSTKVVSAVPAKKDCEILNNSTSNSESRGEMSKTAIPSKFKVVVSTNLECGKVDGPTSNFKFVKITKTASNSKNKVSLKLVPEVLANKDCGKIDKVPSHSKYVEQSSKIVSPLKSKASLKVVSEILTNQDCGKLYEQTSNSKCREENKKPEVSSKVVSAVPTIQDCGELDNATNSLYLKGSVKTAFSSKSKVLPIVVSAVPLKVDCEKLKEPTSNSKCVEEISEIALSSSASSKLVSAFPPNQNCRKLDSPTSNLKCLGESSKTASSSKSKDSTELVSAVSERPKSYELDMSLLKSKCVKKSSRDKPKDNFLSMSDSEILASKIKTNDQTSVRKTLKDLLDTADSKKVTSVVSKQPKSCEFQKLISHSKCVKQSTKDKPKEARLSMPDISDTKNQSPDLASGKNRAKALSVTTVSKKVVTAVPESPKSSEFEKRNLNSKGTKKDKPQKNHGSLSSEVSFLETQSSNKALPFTTDPKKIVSTVSNKQCIETHVKPNSKCVEQSTNNEHVSSKTSNNQSIKVKTCSISTSFQKLSSAVSKKPKHSTRKRLINKKSTKQLKNDISRVKHISSSKIQTSKIVCKETFSSSSQKVKGLSDNNTPAKKDKFKLSKKTVYKFFKKPKRRTMKKCEHVLKSHKTFSHDSFKENLFCGPNSQPTKILSVVTTQTGVKNSSTTLPMDIVPITAHSKVFKEHKLSEYEKSRSKHIVSSKVISKTIVESSSQEMSRECAVPNKISSKSSNKKFSIHKSKQKRQSTTSSVKAKQSSYKRNFKFFVMRLKRHFKYSQGPNPSCVISNNVMSNASISCSRVETFIQKFLLAFSSFQSNLKLSTIWFKTICMPLTLVHRLGYECYLNYIASDAITKPATTLGIFDHFLHRKMSMHLLNQTSTSLMCSLKYFSLRHICKFNPNFAKRNQKKLPKYLVGGSLANLETCADPLKVLQENTKEIFTKGGCKIQNKITAGMTDSKNLPSSIWLQRDLEWEGFFRRSNLVYSSENLEKEYLSFCLKKELTFHLEDNYNHFEVEGSIFPLSEYLPQNKLLYNGCSKSKSFLTSGHPRTTPESEHSMHSNTHNLETKTTEEILESMYSNTDDLELPGFIKEKDRKIDYSLHEFIWNNYQMLNVYKLSDLKFHDFSDKSLDMFSEKYLTHLKEHNVRTYFTEHEMLLPSSLLDGKMGCDICIKDGTGCPKHSITKISSFKSESSSKFLPQTLEFSNRKKEASECKTLSTFTSCSIKLEPKENTCIFNSEIEANKFPSNMEFEMNDIAVKKEPNDQSCLLNCADKSLKEKEPFQSGALKSSSTDLPSSNEHLRPFTGTTQVQPSTQTEQSNDTQFLKTFQSDTILESELPFLKVSYSLSSMEKDNTNKGEEKSSIQTSQETLTTPEKCNVRNLAKHCSSPGTSEFLPETSKCDTMILTEQDISYSSEVMDMLDLFFQNAVDSMHSSFVSGKKTSGGKMIESFIKNNSSNASQNKTLSSCDSFKSSPISLTKDRVEPSHLLVDSSIAATSNTSTEQSSPCLHLVAANKPTTDDNEALEIEKSAHFPNVVVPKASNILTKQSSPRLHLVANKPTTDLDETFANEKSAHCSTEISPTTSKNSESTFVPKDTTPGQHSSLDDFIEASPTSRKPSGESTSSAIPAVKKTRTNKTNSNCDNDFCRNPAVSKAFKTDCPFKRLGKESNVSAKVLKTAFEDFDLFGEGKPLQCYYKHLRASGHHTVNLDEIQVDKTKLSEETLASYNFLTEELDNHRLILRGLIQLASDPGSKSDMKTYERITEELEYIEGYEMACKAILL